MRHTYSLIGAAALSMMSLSAAADETSGPAWIFVQTASEFSVEGTTLNMPYEREIFAFTDRPDRLHMHLGAEELEELWGTGEDSFAVNPPNAVLTWVYEDDIREAEIELLAMEVSDDGQVTSYDFAFEAGDDLPQTASYVSLFIDLYQFNPNNLIKSSRMR